MEKKILIVEDDIFTKELYKFMLKKTGLIFTILEDGDELLKELEHNNVSLIIMDINLKNTYLNKVKVSGIELSKFIKQDIRYSTIPVIIVSAYSENIEGREFIKAALAEDYVTKPITDVKSFVKKILDYID